ncbi:hypothetical protein DFH29DRAFT_932285 [Suillus ampliporus]|nr:hypothetical protein DFH29DRAFT_932285 [Suillus ampliporus]
MSSLLSKSFEAPKPLQQTEVSTRRRPFNLVRPERQSYVHYYGYPVSRDWLIHRSAKNYENTARTRAYELIRAWAGICTLARKECFNPKGGSVPPEWIALYDGVYDDELDDEELMSIQIDTVLVLAVCSDQDDSYEWRPMQENMDFMTKLIGHTPQWWVSCGYAD